MSVLLTYEKIILCPRQNVRAANQVYTYFYVPLANKVIFFTRPFWVNGKMGSFEEAAHYERKDTRYRIIRNAIKLFLLKKYSQNWSASPPRWKSVECLGQTNPSYLTSAQGGSRDSNDEATQVGQSTPAKQTNVITSNGEPQLDETENIPTDAEPHLLDRHPLAIHQWNKKMVKMSKGKPPHYDIDPSAKTKKIQIYYNCEMTDLERKICKIKKFLRNGNPVDILLICDGRATQKGGEKEKKKSKTNGESPSEGGPASTCKEKNIFTNSALPLQPSEATYSPHVNVRVNFLMRHLAKIAAVEETFGHVQKGRRVHLIKLFPR
ncbi:hypothetical protein, conserved [Plasmodium vivax]|uniref:Translation initiation factor IF-3 n=1 Tax=Plasmodium vivax (strain Salvador I) TaxID=126793 RepID=A5KDV4_PLAVS|nr:hypothetical protein, conserved [Plasmodium vivax]EDL42400.1 hypothetical protein, conserved [Plasmodium vivax]|eukprot:XP_001608424.1 hypothetical protein [Plasmodium vivax Sal-1]